MKYDVIRIMVHINVLMLCVLSVFIADEKTCLIIMPELYADL